MIQLEDTGLIETDKNKYFVNKKDVIELRKILDKLKIHYILDRVSFHSAQGPLALAKAIHETDVWKVEKDGSFHLDNQFGHSSKFRYEHLIIPGFHLIQSEIINASSITSEEKLFLRRFK